MNNLIPSLVAWGGGGGGVKPVDHHNGYKEVKVTVYYLLNFEVANDKQMH